MKIWFKNANVFRYKQVIFPINFRNFHWVFVCFYFFLENHIRCYDSGKTYLTKNDEERYVGGVFRCVKDDWIDKHNGEPKDWTDWKLIIHRADTRVQPNSKLFIFCYTFRKHKTYRDVLIHFA